MDKRRNQAKIGVMASGYEINNGLKDRTPASFRRVSMNMLDSVCFKVLLFLSAPSHYYKRACCILTHLQNCSIGYTLHSISPQCSSISYYPLVPEAFSVNTPRCPFKSKFNYSLALHSCCWQQENNVVSLLWWLFEMTLSVCMNESMFANSLWSLGLKKTNLKLMFSFSPSTKQIIFRQLGQ